MVSFRVKFFYILIDVKAILDFDYHMLGIFRRGKKRNGSETNRVGSRGKNIYIICMFDKARD